MFVSNISTTNLNSFHKTLPNKENTEKQADDFSVSDTFESTGKNRTKKKDWTVLCYSKTSQKLEDSFKKTIPSLHSSTTTANFLVQLAPDEKLLENVDNKIDSKRYVVDTNKTVATYKSVPIQDSSDNLQDFVSWGMKNYPAKNYVIVLPQSDAAETFTKENFHQKFASNPEMQKIIPEINSGEKSLKSLDGFDAFAIISPKDNKNVYNNRANLMANTAHSEVGVLSEEKIDLDSDAKKLKSYFRKYGDVKDFNRYVNSIHYDGLMSRAIAKESALSITDLVCIKHYSVNGYRAINKSIIDGITWKLNALEPLIDATTEALDKLPSYEGTVYRTTTLPKNVLKEHVPGTEIEYKAFTSTSKYDGWGGKNCGGESAFLTIECSSKGKDVSWISECPHEDEIIFPPKTTFTVLSNVKKGGRHYIHLCEKTPE